MAIGNLKAYTVPSMLAYKNQRREPTRFEAHKDPIHSGHFMVSNVHDDNADDDDSDGEKNLAPLTPEPGYNFVTANKETSDTYQFGPRSTKTMGLDPTLTKLFQCMTLAYSGTITSPKWKTFRGLSLAVKDKVRLNNIIWREWHMQYVFKRMPVVCQFATPLSDDIHLKPEAVVLEGKYWKRRLDTVTAEYKKWRRYFKNRRVSGNRGDDFELLNRVADADPAARRAQQSSTDLLLTGDSELEAMDFSDSLFQNLNQPFMFPNPRELSQLGGCSDLIQPNLIPLQPDFMDTDFDIFTSRMFTTEPELQSFQAFMPANSMSIPTSMDTSVGVADSVDLLPNNFVSTATVGSNNNNNSAVAFSLSLQHLLANFEGAGAQVVTTQTPQPALPPQPPLAPSSTPVPMSQTFGCLGTQSPSQKAPNLTSVLTGKPLAQPAVSVSKTAPAAPSPGRSSRSRQSQGGRGSNQFNRTTSAASPPSQGKDGFAVPQGKPLQTPRKPRTIAPAPPTTTAAPAQSPSSANTYLAQLLTKGTYPGAVIDVKKEPAEGACAGNFTPIRPAAPVLQSALTQAPLTQASFSAQLPLNNLDFAKVMKSDFATSMVIAAASQALGTSTKDILTFSTTSNTALAVTPSPMSPLSADASPQSAYSPASPPNDFGLPNSPGTLSFGVKEDGDSKGPYQEHRRQAHLSAEQKRRCNLKVRQPLNQTGFDALLTLVPSLAQNPKVSKAAMLQKTADYCKKLKNEKIQMSKESDILRTEIETLNNEISILQSHLPETGVPVTRQRVDHLKEMFQDYVRTRTLQNWKFFIFSHIIRPLFDSYNGMVSTANMDELCRTFLAWLDQHCSLTALRPTALNAMRCLSTTTSILSEPSRVREQATEAVTRRNSTGSARDARH